MTGIDLKKLGQIEKSIALVLDGDDEALDSVTKSFDGLRASIKNGDAITMDDISDILGDITVRKAEDDVIDTRGAGEDEPADPIAPIFQDLYKQIFDETGAIRKGIDATSGLELFTKAYHASLGELDAAIGAAAEAVAIELGQGDRVNFGKHAPGRDMKKPAPGSKPGAQDNDGDEDDMEKLLKSLGANPALIRKIGTLQDQVTRLQTERDIVEFTKAAEEIGEPDSFGADLLKLHTLDPKLCDSIKKRLATKNTLLRKSNAWSAEIGGEGLQPNGGAPYDKLVSHANELVSKSAGGAKPLTFAKAFVDACNQHPDLYNEYQSERRAGRA